MKALLESGVHFGHRTNKWHPAMKSYIFTSRNNIHIIDLQQTVKAVETAYEVVRDTVADGGIVLFVGTKRQAQETIETEALRCGMPYVIYRWLGGTLTNWRTIRERINELERLERMRDSGEFEQFTKKEALNFNRKIERLDMLLGGVRNMGRLPDLLFVVDVRREETAIHEANLLRIPVLAMVDTNCDPSNVDYIIPSNDDAIRAIKLLVGKIADAVLEGKALRKEEAELEDALRMELPRIDEEEIPDEELLGEATLAKISPRSSALIEDEIEEDEFYEKDDEDIELDEAELDYEEEGAEVEGAIAEVSELTAETETEVEGEDEAEMELESEVVSSEIVEEDRDVEDESGEAEGGMDDVAAEVEQDAEQDADNEEIA